MKNISTKITLFIAAAALCISINACKKSTTDSDLSTVTDESQAENESNYIGNAADAAASTAPNAIVERSGQGQNFLPSCASIALDSANGLKTCTITFNECVCADGNKVRNGQIIVTWTGRYRDSGTVIHTYTGSTYTVNGNPHQYSKWVTNIGRINGLYTFNVVDTAKITFPSQNNATITWTSSRVRTWTSGYGSPWWQYWDDVYSITGTAAGVDRKGVSFTVTVTNPIIAEFSCPWVLVKGTFDVQPAGKAERIIDFGSGTCDDNATCTIDGVTYNFQFGNY